jgi:hypothetical protein
MSGYNAGRCRCQHCKDAAAIYRAQRRSAGKDAPRRPRTVDTDGHISRDWFRQNIWRPALKRAGLMFPVRAHDLRQLNASHCTWVAGAAVQAAHRRHPPPPDARRLLCAIPANFPHPEWHYLTASRSAA